MMFRHGIRKYAGPWLSRFNWAAGLIAGVLAGAQKVDLASFDADSHLRREAVAFAQDVGWWLAPLLLVLVGAAKVLSDWMGSQRISHALQAALDTMRDQIFGKDDAEPTDRVTLFRCFLWKAWLPRGRCLVAVERSGHVKRTSSVAFRAPDDPDKAEGVAGVAWVKQRTITVPALPDLKLEGCTEDQRKKYAKWTFVSRDWLDKEKPTSRSLCAIPVEVSGRKWGVIVVDSRRTEDLKPRSEEAYRAVAHIVSRLL